VVVGVGASAAVDAGVVGRAVGFAGCALRRRGCLGGVDDGDRGTCRGGLGPRTGRRCGWRRREAYPISCGRGPLRGGPGAEADGVVEGGEGPRRFVLPGLCDDDALDALDAGAGRGRRLERIDERGSERGGRRSLPLRLLCAGGVCRARRSRGDLPDNDGALDGGVDVAGGWPRAPWGSGPDGDAAGVGHAGGASGGVDGVGP